MIESTDPFAFPCHFGDGIHQYPLQVGLTTRDYFAARAMEALIPHTAIGVKDLQAMARRSYQIADAMLQERAR